MTRLALAALLVVLFGCAKPDPLDRVRSAIELGDLEAAAIILAPYAASAEPDVPAPPFEPRIVVKWTHPDPERIERIDFAVKPQGYTWFSSVQSLDVNEGQPRSTALRGSWKGCAEVYTVAWNGMRADGTRVRSGNSNTITVGTCLDPPPTLVPEPDTPALLGFGALTLVGLYMAGGRNP